MQNTMLYDHNGEFDHNRFRIEMFKTLLLAKIVKNDLSNIEAPCLQLESLWKIYKSQLIRNVENYFYFLNNEGILRDVTNHIGKKLAIFYDAVITQSSLNTSEMNIEISMPIYGYFKNITTGAQFRTKNNVYRYVNYLNNNDKTANESFSNLNAIKTMYMHLKTICNLNSNKILVLNRHHLSGDPIKNVSIENKNQLYLLDPMGGVFYQNEHHCNKHTQMINNFFIWLSEFSQFSKLNLINHFNNNQSPQ